MMILMRYVLPRKAVIEAGLPLDAVENLMETLIGDAEVDGDLLIRDVTVTLQVDGDLWDACEEWMGHLANVQTFIRPQDMPYPRPQIWMDGTRIEKAGAP